MKLKVTLSAEKPLFLPLHYNYILQSFIYKNMEGIYSTFLHNYGFPYRKRFFKLLTFSKLYGRRSVIKGTKRIIFFPPVHFYVSCILEEILSSHVKVLLGKEELRLGRNEVFLKSVEAITEKVEGDRATLKTLSPVTIHSTNENKNTIYYNPEQEKFYRLLEENLKKKCRIAGIREELENMEISPAEDAFFKKVVVLYKNNFVIEGWKGKFLIKADPKIIEIALKAGLGDRNSQGFGMIALC
jgi:CRISPR-associated endoribonuclease Cas6